MSLSVKELSENIVSLLEDLEDLRSHKECHTLCGCDRTVCIYNKPKSDIKYCRNCKNALCYKCVERCLLSRKSGKYKMWICQMCYKNRYKRGLSMRLKR